MLVVGLTGNIAAGKTTAAGMFSRLGAEIIDVDKLGHKLLRPGNVVWKRIISNFGEEILNSNQCINRRRLGKIVFDDSKNLKRLNAIVHPFLIREVKKENSRLQKKKKDGVVIIDGALLVELKPLFEILDRLILLKINQAVQIKRLRKSQGRLKGNEIMQRIKAQAPQEGKIKLADYVIDNSGSLSAAKRQVKEIWKKLTE